MDSHVNDSSIIFCEIHCGKVLDQWDGSAADVFLILQECCKGMSYRTLCVSPLQLTAEILEYRLIRCLPGRMLVCWQIVDRKNVHTCIIQLIGCISPAESWSSLKQHLVLNTKTIFALYINKYTWSSHHYWWCCLLQQLFLSWQLLVSLLNPRCYKVGSKEFAQEPRHKRAKAWIQFTHNQKYFIRLHC